MEPIQGDDAFAQALQTNALVVAHFWADWAEQCKQIDQVLGELGKLYSNLKLVTVEAEKHVELSQRLGVVAVPTVLLFSHGAMVDRVDGANVPLLAKLTEKLSKSRPIAAASTAAGKGTAGTAVSSATNGKGLEARLKELINAAPVMLFMKGTPEDPQCGFSRKIVALLKDKGVEFSYFNILADSDVRQGLKEYSDWPTFPQLYIAGDLVGGLDIVTEMAETGELDAAIPKKEDLEMRLEKLVKRERVMAFIKGTREAPRCGFSRTLLGILAEEGVDFGYYDILGDEEVRQGLKKYSDWPTYPQLYVNGELLGGLDIVKEMKASNDLKSALGV
eukprot:m.32569 g.32569  ORF g.32569 m.32569 type:complete len:333 (-) comp7060_c0_seq1:1064-2062(-)